MCFMLYITFLVLIYLKTGTLSLGTSYIQFSLHPIIPPNHKSNLIFYEFACFWNMIVLQHCVGLPWRLSGKESICLPMQETRVPSLGWEDPLETGMAHSSSLAWKIPWTEEPGSVCLWWRGGGVYVSVHGVAQSQTRLKRRRADTQSTSQVC